MLGRLLGSVRPGSQTAATSLESATEEQHTRSLLFPQADQDYFSSRFRPISPLSPSITAPSRSGEYDDRGGLDLEQNDLRITIAQDGIGDQDEPVVLLDTDVSNAAISNSHGVQSTRLGGSSHRRGLSYAQNAAITHGGSVQRTLPQSPLASPTGYFQPRNRSSTMTSSNTTALEASEVEKRESLRAILGCMFGTSPSSRAASTTKLHFIPAIARNESGLSLSSPPQANREVDDGPRSRVREPLARAHTYGSQTTRPARDALTPTEQGNSQDMLLLTRLFSVPLPESSETVPPEAPTQEGSETQPASNQIKVQRVKPRKLKEKKTPAYAVGILVTLRPQSVSRPISRRDLQAPRSPSFEEALSTSVSSDLQGSWAIVDAMIPKSSSTLQSDRFDGSIDRIMERWDVIGRTLSLLEAESSKYILKLLKQVDEASFVPLPKPRKEKTMQFTNQRIVQLQSSALRDNRYIQKLCAQSIQRLIYAFRIPRAQIGVGLSPGGPWLEEARWLARLCGGREHNFFMFNLLTAFLGTHTEWLAALAPEWYRKRHHQLSKSTETNTILSRTIIVCQDRPVGRRLIFLLASFLPSDAQQGLLPKLKRSASSVYGPQSKSQSPPHSSFQPQRQESLRRTVNRRVRDSRLRATPSQEPVLSSSASSQDQNQITALFEQSSDRLGLRRKNPETPSVRTATLPMPMNENALRKSSTATVSTATPSQPAPTVHFARNSQEETTYVKAWDPPDSRDRSASSELALQLHRSRSSFSANEGLSSTASSRWGSLISGVSGLWSAKSDSPAKKPDHTDVSSGTTPESPIAPRPDTRATSTDKSPSRLEEMAEEVGRPVIESIDMPPSLGELQIIPTVDDPPLHKILPSPRLAVDDGDGVVDVEIPLPGFLSIGSSLSSPPPQGIQNRSSMTSLDGHSSLHSVASQRNLKQSSRRQAQTNVAGFLKRYHQDFALQAVRPYSDLEEELRESMRAEPTPGNAVAQLCSQDDAEVEACWADVCSTLIADVRINVVRRLTLQRKVLLKAPTSRRGSLSEPPDLSPMESSTGDLSAKSNVQGVVALEERFTTETVNVLDKTLTDVVERVLKRGSQQPSRAPSPARSMHSRNVSASTTATNDTSAVYSSSLPRPAGALPSPSDLGGADYKQAVIGALEDVVNSVNADLNNKHEGVDIEGKSNQRTKLQAEGNALREGVKRWMICVENTEVW